MVDARGPATCGDEIVVLTGLDPAEFGGADGLGVHSVVEEAAPSTVVVRAVTRATYRTDEEA